MPRSEFIEKRSTANIVVMFFILPTLAGGGLFVAAVVQAVAPRRELAGNDWLGLGFMGLLGLLLTLSLPAAGWQELRRRRRERRGESKR